MKVNKENLASEVFKEQTSQSTYNIHPDLSQDAHSVTKFDDVSGLPGLRCSMRGVYEVYSNSTCRNGSSGFVLKMWPNSFNLRFNHVREKSSTSESKSFLRISKTF